MFCEFLLQLILKLCEQTSPVVAKVSVRVDATAEQIMIRSRLSPQAVLSMRVGITVGIGYGKNVPSDAIDHVSHCRVGGCKKLIDEPESSC